MERALEMLTLKIFAAIFGLLFVVLGIAAVIVWIMEMAVGEAFGRWLNL